MKGWPPTLGLRLMLAGLALGWHAPAFAAEARCAQDPAAVALQFYRTIIAQGDSGLPSADQMRVLSGLMSQQLIAAIESARTYQNDYIAAHPDEKPPFIEGSLFTSLFEGASTVERTKLLSSKGGQQAKVRAYLAYDDSTADKPVRWHDQVQLRCESGQWRVDDTVAEGRWAFGNRGSLRHGLEHPE